MAAGAGSVAYGIFTLASTAYETFEHAIKPEIPTGLWVRAEAQVGSNKVACSRFIAENSTCPKKVATLMRQVMLHLRKQGADIRIPAENSDLSSGVQSEG